MWPPSSNLPCSLGYPVTCNLGCPYRILCEWENVCNLFRWVWPLIYPKSSFESLKYQRISAVLKNMWASLWEACGWCIGAYQGVDDSALTINFPRHACRFWGCNSCILWQVGRAMCSCCNGHLIPLIGVEWPWVNDPKLVTMNSAKCQVSNHPTV
jgi:hypothetical protein